MPGFLVWVQSPLLSQIFRVYFSSTAKRRTISVLLTKYGRLTSLARLLDGGATLLFGIVFLVSGGRTGFLTPVLVSLLSLVIAIFLLRQ
ncbi:MAG: hypothetical protein BMS9Abin02_1776 [Anaerolineae bacterium]|nr:MAG: hypothetical protein BMS9Abin02_1776 [Anaerolineae bacterium]